MNKKITRGLSIGLLVWGYKETLAIFVNQAILALGRVASVSGDQNATKENSRGGQRAAYESTSGRH